MTGRTANPPPDRRLRSWKEIAHFFGKDERTVKRWEAQRGLPVHRVPGSTRTSVYAYARELEEWLKKPSPALAPEEPAPAPEPAIEVAAPPPRFLLFRAQAAVLLLGLLLAIGAVSAFLYRSAPQPAVIGDDTVTEPLSPSIHDLYLAGRYNLSTRTPEGLTRALEQFTQIIARDPNHAGAYAELANTYNLLPQYALMPADIAYPQAKTAAERAIRLDGKLAAGYSALAFTEFFWSRDFARSEQLFEQALALDPNSAQTYAWYALTIMHSGEFGKALAAISKAQELDPESRAILANKALMLFHAGNSKEAIAVLKELRRTAPGHLATHFYLATMYLDEEDYEGYLRESLKAAELQRNDAMRRTFEAAQKGYQADGARGLFAALLDAQRLQFDHGREQAFNVARTAGVIGDADTAMAYLRKSKEIGETDILAIRIDRSFKKLWPNEDFRALAAEIGFPFPQTAGLPAQTVPQ
ncbi:MAG: tetratricopeptide repeat protein [Pseudomonadota bacterium]